MNHASQPNDAPRDFRRLLVFVFAVAFLAGWVGLWWFGESKNSEVIAGGAGRIGLVLGALCLAWDSLRKPAQWLPSGMAFACVIALVVLAAQPRLIIAAVPAIAALIAISALVRASRGPK